MLKLRREVRGAMGGGRRWAANVRVRRWVPSPNRWGICQLQRVVGWFKLVVVMALWRKGRLVATANTERPMRFAKPVAAWRPRTSSAIRAGPGRMAPVDARARGLLDVIRSS